MSLFGNENEQAAMAESERRRLATSEKPIDRNQPEKIREGLEEAQRIRLRQAEERKTEISKQREADRQELKNAKKPSQRMAIRDRHDSRGQPQKTISPQSIIEAIAKTAVKKTVAPAIDALAAHEPQNRGRQAFTREISQVSSAVHPMTNPLFSHSAVTPQRRQAPLTHSPAQPQRPVQSNNQKYFEAIGFGAGVPQKKKSSRFDSFVRRLF